MRIDDKYLYIHVFAYHSFVVDYTYRSYARESRVADNLAAHIF